MDRKGWIAIIFSFLGIAAWYWYIAKYQPPVPPKVTATATATVTPQASASPGVSASAESLKKASSPSLTPQKASLYTKTAEYSFLNDSGGLANILLYFHQSDQMQNVILNQNDVPAIGSLEMADNVPLNGFTMETNAATGEAVFKKSTADGIEITKRFQIPQGEIASGQYLLTFEISFKNTTASDVIFPSCYVNVGGAAPIHATDQPTYTRFDWLREEKMTDIMVTWFRASAIPLIGIQLSPEKAIYSEVKDKISWAAVSSQYFCTILNSQDSNATSVWAKRFLVSNQDNKPVYGIEGALGFPETRIAAGQTVTRSLTIYAGPKDYSVLKKLGSDQQAIMKYGWFKYVSVSLLWSMNKLYALLGSYALAIIVLTLCIKLVLWYPQNKATESMKRMSALSPKMNELREKYKDDPTKLNEEMMKLYREYNVNPIGGCLPMLIQIPLFFGFYTMLGTAIELRNSSFLWVHDLSQPDTVAHIMGFPINILPLIMAGSMLWQMSLTPKSGDAAQQRFMFFMPVIFIAFCYNYASALALYWTTQNIFSIVQLYLTRNRATPKLEKKSDVARKLALEEKKKRKRK